MIDATKAAMYKTAQVKISALAIPDGFSAGEFVAVRHIGQREDGMQLFDCTNIALIHGVISEHELCSFVL